MSDNMKFKRQVKKDIKKAIDARTEDSIMVIGTHFFSIATKALTFLKELGLFYEFLGTLSDKDKRIVDLTIELEVCGLSEVFNNEIKGNKVEEFLGKPLNNKKR